MSNRFANNGSAVEVTKLCYNESTRNLDFRIKCADLEDCIECLKVIDQYNDFDAKKVSNCLKECFGDAGFSYEIGREGSPVLYVNFLPIAVQPITNDELKKRMREFELHAKVDEADFTRGFGIEMRFWWD